MNNDQLILKKAQSSDIKQIVPLVKGYLEFYNRHVKDKEIEGFVKQRFKNQESVLLLAVHEGKTVGFTHLYPMFSTLSLSKIWILNDLYVSQGCRGLGVGRSLIDTAVSYAKKDGACRLDLKTEHDNVAAQHLYDRYGFDRDETYIHFNLKL